MSDDLVRVPVGDLIYLRREWHASVDDETVRLTSGVLRRLLVEGDYLRAWRAIGFDHEPKVIAPRIEPLVERGKIPGLQFALAGGAQFGGEFGDGGFHMETACYIESRQLVDPDNLPPPLAIGDECRSYEWGLRKFIHSAGMFAEGRKVSRQAVILFACNKLGGVHLDPTDRPTKMDGVIRRTEKNGRLGGKMPAWFEVLSIGQHLAKSPDTERFIARARGND